MLWWEGKRFSWQTGDRVRERERKRCLLDAWMDEPVSGVNGTGCRALPSAAISDCSHAWWITAAGAPSNLSFRGQTSPYPLRACIQFHPFLEPERDQQIDVNTTTSTTFQSPCHATAPGPPHFPQEHSPIFAFAFLSTHGTPGHNLLAIVFPANNEAAP